MEEEKLRVKDIKDDIFMVLQSLSECGSYQGSGAEEENEDGNMSNK